MLSTTGINMRNDSYVFWTSESPTMNMGRRETMCCILLALKSGNSQSSGTHVYLVISSDLLRGHLNSPSTWDLSYNGGFADICHLPFVKSHGFFPFASKCKLKTPISHKMVGKKVWSTPSDLTSLTALPMLVLTCSLRTKG
ncbi:unnamed protein product [Prorocentrum cordatum]|uniref:Uncharacterized protein n=1 Tax=Prorocentrum cordatum TaxID=2364126 RepID=A0ABN9SB55_9DINO|nr:unnamed protein product [Polarella glacialis]